MGSCDWAVWSNSLNKSIRQAQAGRRAFRPSRLECHRDATLRRPSPVFSLQKQRLIPFLVEGLETRPRTCRALRTMNNEKRSEYFTRDSIMKLLSDEEIAKVTATESATSLMDGDEYIDLEQLDQGVQTVPGSTAAIAVGRVVARKAVQELTWKNVVTQLASRRIVPVHPGESSALTEP